MAMVRVQVRTADALAAEGLSSYLRQHPDITVLTDDVAEVPDVLLVETDRLTFGIISMLRHFTATVDRPVVLVVSEIDESQLMVLVENRVAAIIPRAAVGRERLVHSVLAAADGGGVMPARLMGELLHHFRRMQREVLQPNGLTLSGLTAREVEVLRLMADGLDTNEIAEKMRYSVRTVKTIIYGVMDRYQLRNRSHVVAYAVRAGVI
ncbi:helix-turn-helix transcriptional regulator [Paractinoplanes brasiliensis]|uniref:DNA-binding NarL/FixJ family response regulator n=1 Tax=Paractinoplanes brasiliensis TaxID=52695 RepID=A0A4R6JNT8_9ACTN|nr:response regulator transcription factor [Actinoplanes brasiliensis]TDO37041.1 DNA-binding NarL/FixJ family response regulator [Actinoplanes brasiliensis]GID32265.1 helix-turn-helix transcriptional regulator [Actinoplanes brasiliensis]